jgi:hypothetical protein
MAHKLTDINKSSANESNGRKLTNRKDKKFKFAITGSLDNGFCFKKLKQNEIAEFHKFIDNILSKQLTITEVDKIFLRTKGEIISKEDVFGKKRDIQHYGKDNTKFRIHGYFNNDDYFVIYQIDPKHKKHNG